MEMFVMIRLQSRSLILDFNFNFQYHEIYGKIETAVYCVLKQLCSIENRIRHEFLNKTTQLNPKWLVTTHKYIFVY